MENLWNVDKIKELIEKSKDVNTPQDILLDQVIYFNDMKLGIKLDLITDYIPLQCYGFNYMIGYGGYQPQPQPDRYNYGANLTNNIYNFVLNKKYDYSFDLIFTNKSGNEIYKILRVFYDRDLYEVNIIINDSIHNLMKKEIMDFEKSNQTNTYNRNFKFFDENIEFNYDTILNHIISIKDENQFIELLKLVFNNENFLNIIITNLLHEINKDR